ncbi:MAG: hypothetical protein QXS79_02295 [Candidatus Bathyarchaeia archaeon]
MAKPTLSGNMLASIATAVPEIMAAPRPWMHLKDMRRAKLPAYGVKREAIAKTVTPPINIGSLPIQSATAPIGSIVEAIEIKKELATQLATAISTLKVLAIAGRAIFVAMAINGVRKDAVVDAAKKRLLLDILGLLNEPLALHKNIFILRYFPELF